jgi:GT2 family glycosyltransferase
MNPELSIIIVQYKTPELLDRCIYSIYTYSSDISVEIIVVNNDMEDISQAAFAAKFPNVQWINSGYNAGFSRANNIGIHRSLGEYILILNPDTEIKEGFLKHFLSFYKARDASGALGLLGCRIISSIDGSLLIGSGTGFPSITKIVKANPIYLYIARTKPSIKNYDAYQKHYTDHEIDFVSGACVLIKRDKVIKNKLFFDEDFFLYYEDVEWSHRVKDNGFMNYFCSEIEIYHVNSASTGFSKGKFFQMQISAYLYYLKVYGAIGYLCLGSVLFSNFLLNIFLLKRAGQYEQYQTEREQYKVFKKYFLRILRLYHFPSLQSRHYLQYASQN